jgi:hypothetical protein
MPSAAIRSARTSSLVYARSSGGMSGKPRARQSGSPTSWLIPARAHTSGQVSSFGPRRTSRSTSSASRNGSSRSGTSDRRRLYAPPAIRTKADISPQRADTPGLTTSGRGFRASPHYRYGQRPSHRPRHRGLAYARTWGAHLRQPLECEEVLLAATRGGARALPRNVVGRPALGAPGGRRDPWLPLLHAPRLPVPRRAGRHDRHRRPAGGVRRPTPTGPCRPGPRRGRGSRRARRSCRRESSRDRPSGSPPAPRCPCRGPRWSSGRARGRRPR